MFQRLPGNNQKGMSFIEILVVVFILSAVLSSILGMTSFSLNAVNFAKQAYKANMLAQELLERVRGFRDQTSWDADGLGTVLDNTDYYIAKTGNPLMWQMVQGTDSIDGFTAKVVFHEVRRDGSDNIIESGGTVDSDTKKITASVVWEQAGKMRQVELVTYLTNWK